MLASLVVASSQDGEDASPAGRPIGPKSTLVDQLPNVIEIEVTTANGFGGNVKKDSSKRNGTPRAILKTGMAEKGKENQGTYYLK